MKFIYIILATLLLLTDVKAQTVYTCKGGAVSALTNSEFSQQDIAYYNNLTNTTYAYLGMTFLDNSSAQYNCHAYAWHLREGNTNKVWINNAYENDPNNCFPQTNNIHTYWNDGCFIQVCNEADADKVHYYCGDHSAVKSTTHPGYYESKWGAMPLYRHTLLGVPYNQQSSHNFYASTNVTGDASQLCSGSRSFSVKSITGATYTWTYSSTLLPVGGTSGNQLTVQRNGTSSGAGWVQVVIATPCSGITATQRVNFQVGSTAPAAILPGPTTPWNIEAYVNPVPGATSYKWYKNGVLVPSQNGPMVDVLVTCGVNTQIGVEAVSACGTSARVLRTFNPSCSFGGGAFMVSPNPAVNTITIAPRTSNTAKATANANSTFNEIRIYNMQGELKKYIRYHNVKQASLLVNDLSNGLYFIEITNGSYKERQQVSIQK
jgi:hypothetical protein